MAIIQISRRTTTTAEGEFQLQVWVSETSHNIEPEIFVYQRIPRVPLSPCPENMFVHIATYEAMLTLPADEPEEGIVFFRLRQIDLTFKSLEKLEVEFLRMKSHIRTLIADIVKLNKLPPVEVLFVDAD
jgi:hypothetical protein